MKKHLLAFVLCMLVSGCAMLPEWRVFQKKVPPPVENERVTEGQRQAAAFIADKIETPAELKPVAQELSTSLGTPEKPVVDTGDMKADSAKVIATLQKENAELRKRLAKQAEFLKSYAGKEIEGTGVNIFAPASILGIAGVIALFLFVPGTLTAALFVIRRYRSTVQTISQSIEEFKVDNPKAAGDLKQNYLYPNTDKAHRKVIDREKKYINREYIKERTDQIIAAAATPATA